MISLCFSLVAARCNAVPYESGKSSNRMHDGIELQDCVIIFLLTGGPLFLGRQVLLHWSVFLLEWKILEILSVLCGDLIPLFLFGPGLALCLFMGFPPAPRNAFPASLCLLPAFFHPLLTPNPCTG